ncbi:hypothetical protein [Aquipuribacter sp. SD81]|uniref:hypothetical protein n=1 Tax=Aquipuribacter sp. SD81 TaxID=3127703 RepID=UPI003016A72C
MRFAAERLASGRDGGRLPVVLTVTDVSPLAVRERVRGRAALAGALHADGRLVPDLVRWQPAVRPGGRARPAAAVDLAAYRGASPDPLAADEADLLLALAAAPGLVAGLAGLLPACVVVDPERPPVPVRLDRDGVVLRVAGAGRSVDARLAFGVDAVTPVLVWAALEELGTRV